MGKIIAGLIGALGLGTIFSFRKYIGIAIVMAVTIYGISHVKNDLVDLVKDSRQHDSALELERLKLEKDKIRIRNEEIVRLEQLRLEKERLRIEQETLIRKEKSLENEINIKKEQMRVVELNLQNAYDEVIKTQRYQQTFQFQLTQTDDISQKNRIRDSMIQNDRYMGQQFNLIENLKKEQGGILSENSISKERLITEQYSLISKERVRFAAEEDWKKRNQLAHAERVAAEARARAEEERIRQSITVRYFNEESYCSTYGWKSGDTLLVWQNGTRVKKTISHLIENNSGRCNTFDSNSRSLYAVVQ